jgi:WD40 repeat protein
MVSPLLLIIASLDVLNDELRLFNLKTGESERLLSAMDSIHNARWSPRKQGIVAIGCNMGYVAVYDVQSK